MGGTTNTGGTTLGGTTSTGGSATLGGSATAGGSATTGGTTSTGGSTTLGGSTSMGGSTAKGGTTNAGGSTSMGGSTAKGGTTNAGGSTSMGGSTSAGGSGGSNTTPGTAINHGVSLVGYGAGTTGGGGKSQVTVSSLSQLEAALKSDVTIMVNGTISGSGMVSIKELSNISIIGVGSNGKFRGIGLSFVRTSNIIVQNLSFENSSDDSVNIEDATRAWVDHNTMSTDVNYLDCDQGSIKDKYDGQIDIKKNSKNITVSFNYVHDACKAVLLGFSDGKEPDDLVTYHHNRFENIGSRLPLIRSADTHVYNNYYKNVLTSGINVRMGANALIENNYFENVDDPILSADSPEIGFWNVSGNIYVPNGPTYTHSPEGADIVGTVVNGEVKSTSTWKVNYTYKLDKANDVPPTVIQYAGAGKI
jgi:pectate lyase